MKIYKTLERNTDMASLYKNGLSLQGIGDRYGVCGERVRQIVKKAGLTGKNGGPGIFTEQRKLKRELKLSAESREKKRAMVKKAFGCPLELYEKLGGSIKKSKPTKAFWAARHQCRHNNIEWNLTLTQWWAIWQKSGKYEKRGLRSNDYLMARIDKKGPVSVENVRIIKAKDSMEYLNEK